MLYIHTDLIVESDNFKNKNTPKISKSLFLTPHSQERNHVLVIGVMQIK